jgi:hypothetical protein
MRQECAESRTCGTKHHTNSCRRNTKKIRYKDSKIKASESMKINANEYSDLNIITNNANINGIEFDTKNQIITLRMMKDNEELQKAKLIDILRRIKENCEQGKKELLEEDIEVLKSNLGVEDDLCYEAIDDLLEYHIYHYSDFEQAREILTSVCDLLSYGYSLQEVTELTPDSDWVSIIDDFLCGEGICPDIKSIEGFVDIFDMEYITNECKKEIVIEDRKNSGSKGGKKSKTNHSKAITIKNKITGKEICFNSAEECAKYLNVSKNTMIRFKQGDTKLNRTWEIISQPIEY